jgi:hypothetical protein
MKRWMDHFVLRRWLSVYADMQLHGALLERVRSHIASCGFCQRDLVSIKIGRDLLANWESAELHVAQRRVSWGWMAAAAAVVVVIIAFRWAPVPTVHAMDVNFYAAQFQSAGYCTYPCTSLAESSLQAVRASTPLALQYPERVPGPIVLSRVIRYRTAEYEGVGLLFAGAGKRFWLFEQPQRLSVATNNLPTGPISICGRECTRIECAQVRLLNWTKDGLSFVVATDLDKRDVETIVASLRRLKS